MEVLFEFLRVLRISPEAASIIVLRVQGVVRYIQLAVVQQILLAVHL